MAQRTARIPLWQYTVTLTNGETVTVPATGYHEDGPWTVFDDVHGTVMSRRTDTITAVHRSPEPTGHQETDQL